MLDLTDETIKKDRLTPKAIEAASPPEAIRITVALWGTSCPSAEQD